MSLPDPLLTVAQVAEAAKAQLATASDADTFSQEFTPLRTYVPSQDLPASVDLAVLVYAKEAENTGSVSRSKIGEEFTIDIAVVKKIVSDPTSTAANAELDPLVQLATELMIFFKPGNALGSTGAIVLRSRMPLPYDAEGLRTKKLFLSVVTITFLNHQLTA